MPLYEVLFKVSHRLYLANARQCNLSSQKLDVKVKRLSALDGVLDEVELAEADRHGGDRHLEQVGEVAAAELTPSV